VTNTTYAVGHTDNPVYIYTCQGQSLAVGTTKQIMSIIGVLINARLDCLISVQ